jgi:hypothetical protein
VQQYRLAPPAIMLEWYDLVLFGLFAATLGSSPLER